ncbi:hypothetical protein FJW08_21240 [Mesorhizobium sp. B3-2-1]|uniref:hypothetical protein n=1 Tax=Mesorhizobium sp. B3-2-1 TaxID=2589891 RepID=UPI00112AD3C7|nr:hypothetical protein [Mesorhizobium sp. B3-2-1]TPI28302.1 hypothetical protein FJW08_21240 [Mesorhizobium sp. B3-2-1]
MIDETAIGTLSISQTILKDCRILREQYDLVIAAVSWESRCYACSSLLTGRSDESLIIHFASSDPEMETRKSGNRATIEGAISDCRILDLDRSAQFTDNAEKLEQEVFGVARKKGHALRVLMDMTCIPKRYLLFLLGLGFRRELFTSIDLVYAEAEKYEMRAAQIDVAGKPLGLISEGEWATSQIPYLESEDYVPDRRNLYISVGAELTQASPIVDRFEPNGLVLYHITEGHRRLPSSVIDRERPALQQLTAFPGVRQEQFELHEIAAVALSVLQNRSAGTTCFAIGPKTHAVAFALAALADDQIQVVCRTPTTYVVNEVKASGKIYFYRINDRFDPASFWSQ